MFNISLEDVMFGGSVIYNVFDVLVLFFVALVCSIITIIKCNVNKVESRMILQFNIIVKLIHIPAYIIIFVFGVLFLITIFTMSFSLAFVVFDMLTILLSGLMGITGVVRGRKEKKIPKRPAIILGIMQFIFCADVLCAIIAYFTVKNRKRIKILPYSVIVAVVNYHQLEANGLKNAAQIQTV
jgi:hypothetical protein